MFKKKVTEIGGKKCIPLHENQTKFPRAHSSWSVSQCSCWKVHLELRPAGACANRTFDNCAPDDALLNTHTRIHSQSRLRNQPLFSLFALNWLSSRLAHCNGLFAALIFNEMLGSAHISLPHPHTGSQLIVLWGRKRVGCRNRVWRRVWSKEELSRLYSASQEC